MTMIDAMEDGLRRMAEVLGGTRKKVDEPLIRAYLWVVEEDSLAPEDVIAAAAHLCRKGEGAFPPGPVFRRECLAQKYTRECRERAFAYQARIDAQGDEFADEFEQLPSKEESHAMIQGALARMAGKFKDWPGNERPRDMKKEIARMQEVGLA